MSRFIVEIDIMPLQGLLDPQGRTVAHALRKLGFEGVASVRVGKHIQMIIESESETEAKHQVEDSLAKLLYNPVVEQYRYVIRHIDP